MLLKPRYSTIDWNDSINVGLIAAWAPGYGMADLTNFRGPQVLNADGGVQATVAGQGRIYNSGTNYSKVAISTGLSNSFSVWALAYRAGAGGSNETILASNVASYGNFWAVLGFTLGFALFDGSIVPIAGFNSTPAVGLVHQVGGVRAAGTISAYLNGLLQNTVADATTTPAYGDFSIGTQSSIPNRFMIGAVIGGRVWRRALRPSEFLRLQADPWAGLHPTRRFARLNSAAAPVSTCAPTLSLMGIGCGIQAARAMIRNRVVRRRGVIAELLGVNDE